MSTVRNILRSCVLLLAVFGSHVSFAQQIIPRPTSMTSGGGTFTITGNTAIVHKGQSPVEAEWLRDLLKAEFGLSLPINSTSKSQIIQLVLDSRTKQQFGTEGYRLSVTPGKILVTAPDNAGIFYGLQSLRQLIQPAGNQALNVPVTDVTDSPRFSWRAFMLDEGRHFQGMSAVKQLLDEMALLKMNTFHWHLTDDQGWRIEIKKYPLLTQVGSHRDSTQTGGWNSKTFDGKKHSGFYTQDQIKEIIQYATARHITIVPEIEMPGHSSAAIAAYPWLGVTQQKIQVPGTFGVHYDIFNVTNPKVIQFLEDVLDEVMALFPSKVIHIGGDEVRYNQWKEDQSIIAFIKEKGLSSPADLQIWFTNSISNYLAGKQHRMMGWNEIMGSKLHEYTDAADVSSKATLAKGTIVHFWKGDLVLVNEAVSKGYDVVNSYHEKTYLDYSYDEIPLREAYEFDPIPAKLDPKYHSRILGSGCQIWGEWTPDIAAVQNQVFPRLAAYAEAGWTTPARKDYDTFLKGLDFFYKHWDKAGIRYHK